MAVGGGSVCVAPPSVEAWGKGRRTSTTTASGPRRGAAATFTVRCAAVGEAGTTGGGLAEDPYRTLRLRPGATRSEVKKAFRRLALMYHPDVRKQGERETETETESDVQFQRINVAYQMVMSSMREAEERLEYWRLKYGLADDDLDRYRHHLNQEHADDWFDV